jgi:hypothetical protein
MKRFLVVFGSLLLASTALVSAQDFGYQGFGLRVGLSVDPDQAYGGIHWDIGSPSSNLRIRPNLELGFGDDAILLAANGEVDWYFRQQGDWLPYAGGALSINFIKVDDLPPQADDSEVELGGYVVGGLETLLQADRKFLMEVKIGFSDSPDFKFGVGWTF